MNEDTDMDDRDLDLPERSDKGRTDILEALDTRFKRPEEEAGKSVSYEACPLGDDWFSLRGLLATRLEDHSVGLHLASGKRHLLDVLANHIYNAGFKRVLLGPATSFALDLRAGLLQRLEGVALVDHSEVTLEQAGDFELAVLETEAVFAQTGTLVLRGASREAMAASLLPRTQYVFAPQSSVVAAMGDWLLKSPPDAQSHVVMVSGPSRTADIEKQVVLGVHGPWTLDLFLYED